MCLDCPNNKACLRERCVDPCIGKSIYIFPQRWSVVKCTPNQQVSLKLFAQALVESGHIVESLITLQTVTATKAISEIHFRPAPQLVSLVFYLDLLNSKETGLNLLYWFRTLILQQKKSSLARHRLAEQTRFVKKEAGQLRVCVCQTTLEIPTPDAGTAFMLYALMINILLPLNLIS